MRAAEGRAGDEREGENKKDVCGKDGDDTCEVRHENGK